ncbi:MAG: hypothetical protein ABEJ22_01525 [Haloferacaceae archaeon]
MARRKGRGNRGGSTSSDADGDVFDRPRLLRQPDLLDYLLVGTVTVLAYLELPFRPAIRRWLRSIPARLAALWEQLNQADPTKKAGFAVLAAVVVGFTFVVFVSEVLPSHRK